MKPVFVLLAIALATPASAADLTAVKDKVDCSVDQLSKTYDQTGKEIFTHEFNGRMSESVRTTWKQDTHTYRFQDNLNYGSTKGADGKWTEFLASKSKSMGKIIREERDGLVNYYGNRRTVKVSLRDNKITETDVSFHEVYSIVNGEEILVKQMIDGRNEPIWPSSMTVTKLNDYDKITVETYQVPHYSYDEKSKTTSVDLKYVVTCTYRKIQE